MEILLPPGWPRPKGYSNAVVAEGRLLFIAGQIGWDETERVVSNDLVEQVRKALSNTVALLKEAGGGPEHLARMTWYVTDKQEYIAFRNQIGEAFRDVIGRHYPAMSLVVVKELLEDRAKVEIESTAVIP